MSLRISSDTFQQGQPIPRTHTEDGENVSPALHISGVPEQAKELALICDDPDAPRSEPFVHWVMYGIPANVSEIPEGIPGDAKIQSPKGAFQGMNSFRKVGYGGPAPPPGHGTHHYHFHVYALDQPIKAKGGLDKKALLDAMQGHVIDQGEIVGTYQRP
jgi:Raf kinase inhibitor-like YbhB/YbcL family protein